MSEPTLQKWQKSRRVTKRIFITGCLVLDTPAHFGNGDSDGLTDISLLRDSLTGQPLLTGSSIAGALRTDVHEREKGYGVQESKDGISQAEQLFGYVSDEQTEPVEVTVESWLMVDDALGNFASKPIEIRDGVQIRRKTRTAEDQFKYDIELLAAGTQFRLHFELWLEESKEEERLRWLAAALHNFEAGNIRLGMRKRRGFGKCHVVGWQVRQFDMGEPQGIVDWLKYRIPDKCDSHDKYQPDILTLLSVKLPDVDNREAFTLQATFRLQHSLLIRADIADGDSPDMLHLRNADGEPILSGTSVAGAIRARAYRIANTLKGEAKAKELLNNMFGLRLTQKEKRTREREERQPIGSRITIDETKIQHPLQDWVQSRVKIDRFTGGAYPQALFSQQPIFAGSEDPTLVQINLHHRNNRTTNFEAEVGLLLLVLKDLWTGDLPLGGESSIGRGRLRGQTACLQMGGKKWVFEEIDGRLHFTEGQSKELEKYIIALHTYLEVPT